MCPFGCVTPADSSGKFALVQELLAATPITCLNPTGLQTRGLQGTGIPQALEGHSQSVAQYSKPPYPMTYAEASGTVKCTALRRPSGDGAIASLRQKGCP